MGSICSRAGSPMTKFEVLVLTVAATRPVLCAYSIRSQHIYPFGEPRVNCTSDDMTKERLITTTISAKSYQPASPPRLLRVGQSASSSWSLSQSRERSFTLSSGKESLLSLNRKCTRLAIRTSLPNRCRDPKSRRLQTHRSIRTVNEALQLA